MNWLTDLFQSDKSTLMIAQKKPEMVWWGCLQDSMGGKEEKALLSLGWGENEGGRKQSGQTVEGMKEWNNTIFMKLDGT